MSSERETLVTKAKELGINTFQKSSAVIAAEIEAAENTDELTDNSEPVAEDSAENDVSVNGEDYPEETEAETVSTPAAALVDPVMVAVIAAQKAAEAYMKEHPVAAQTKPEVSDAEIKARWARDRAAIDRDIKVPFGLEHGGGIGEPSYYAPCVNGKPYGIVVGAGKKLIPLAVAEVMERSFAQHKKNMAMQKKMSKTATDAGI
jgi:post-segregation antitoxin (ccd killing protein)